MAPIIPLSEAKTRLAPDPQRSKNCSVIHSPAQRAQPTPVMSAIQWHHSTVRFPEELLPLVHRRMREEHYHSESALFCGLLVEDLLRRERHVIGPQFMRDPGELQDSTVKEILCDYADGNEGGRNR